MASRLKEDEKNERIIRGLLKLPENKRCINCNSLGPQYVCTTFWTFICTNCSGIHRQFTHRVKSISMAKFTSQEVTTLQEGGNQRAKEIYFKSLDLQRQSLPDGSNVEKLRDFIRHVYVNKRYTGERSDDKPPRGKMGDKDDFHENRPPGGSSPGLRRSPGFEPTSRQYSTCKRSPSHPEVVNDWRRDDDRLGSGKICEDESRSHERTKDFGSSSPPLVRPVRDILGDNVVPLRVNEPPKANGTRAADGSDHKKRTASSTSLGSTENPQEVKLQTTVSLIDFDADPEPPAASTQQSIMPQPVVQPTRSSANDNWASFDAAPSISVSQTPSNANTLDSLLSQLSVPSSVPPVQTSVQPSGPSASIDGTAFQTNPLVAVSDNYTVSPFGPGNYASPDSNFPTVPAAGSLPPASGSLSVQWPDVQQQQPSLFPSHVRHSTASGLQNGASSNQPWNNTSLVSNVQRSLSVPALHPLQGVSIPVQDVTSSGAQLSSAKSTGRKELPEDLFTATYPPFHAAVPGWQGVPPRGMGFNMQYNTAVMPFQSFQQPARSTNPFDFSNEPPPQSQTATQFPSVASLHGALPSTLPPSGLLRTSSLGTALPAWLPSQTLPQPSPMPFQVPGHPSAVPPRYMPPQMQSSVPPSHPSLAPLDPHSFPAGGNPFG